MYEQYGVKVFLWVSVPFVHLISFTLLPEPNISICLCCPSHHALDLFL
jgi:hypothetical protein